MTFSQRQRQPCVCARVCLSVCGIRTSRWGPDVLHAADQTHPPASKRETTPSFIIIQRVRPHKVWLPDEERESVWLLVRHVALCVCVRVCACVCAWMRARNLLFHGECVLKNVRHLYTEDLASEIFFFLSFLRKQKGNNKKKTKLFSIATEQTSKKQTTRNHNYWKNNNRNGFNLKNLETS